MDTQVRDLMNRNPPVINIDADVDEAIIAVTAQPIPELFVVDHRRHLLGVVPDYELLKVHLNGQIDRVSVRNIMNGSVTTIRPSSEVLQVAPLFRNSYLRRLAVVDRRGCLIGTLHRRDVLWLVATVYRIEQQHREVTQSDESAVEPTIDAPTVVEATPAIEPAFIESQIPRPRFLQQQLRARRKRPVFSQK